MTTPLLHVVLGANGGLGAALVRHLSASGESVRAVVRDVAKAKSQLPPEAEVFYADALLPPSLENALRDANVVYPCFNVPYMQWSDFWPRAMENLLTILRGRGITVVFPGNVYGYGPFQSTPFDESHPLAASTRKGQLRNRLEGQLRTAHRAGELKLIVARMPDFYGPAVDNGLMSPIFRGALTGSKIAWPGNPDLPHSLLFIDDAARALVLLAKSPTALGEAWHICGPEPSTARSFIEIACRQAGTTSRLVVYGPRLMRVLGWFSAVIGELNEMLYQFNQPYVMDGGKFQRAFPDFRFTPMDDALQMTLDWFKEHP